MKNPRNIKNKVKRQDVYAKYKLQKKRIKKKLRADRVKETEVLGENAPPKQVSINNFMEAVVKLSLIYIFRFLAPLKIQEKSTKHSFVPMMKKFMVMKRTMNFQNTFPTPRFLFPDNINFFLNFYTASETKDNADD